MTTLIRALLPKLPELNEKERKAFRLHFAYYAIEGIVLGVLALNEFVLLKSLNGTNFQVGVLFQFSVLVLVFSVFINEWIKRIKNKQKMLIIVALITRLPLFIVLIFPNNFNEIGGSSIYHYIFLAIFLIYYFANPLVYPVTNLLLKNSYSHENFGRLFSYSTTVNKIIMLVVTFGYGVILDKWNHSYKFAFPLMAVLGIFSLYLLSKIEYKEEVFIQTRKSLLNSLKGTMQNMRNILKTNKAFYDFEMGFMWYGFAFMGTVSVIAIFFSKELNLSYTSLAFYKNAYNILAIILLPFFGKLIGKMDPRKFAAITFSSLLFYILFILLTQYFPYQTSLWNIQIYWFLIIAITFNGLFAATMSLLWSIGSAYFCKKEDAADYQAIHLSFTGLRSFFAPLLGVLFYQWFGFTITFLIGISFLLISVFLMVYSIKFRREV